MSKLPYLVYHYFKTAERAEEDSNFDRAKKLNHRAYELYFEHYEKLMNKARETKNPELSKKACEAAKNLVLIRINSFNSISAKLGFTSSNSSLRIHPNNLFLI